MKHYLNQKFLLAPRSFSGVGFLVLGSWFLFLIMFIFPGQAFAQSCGLGSASGCQGRSAGYPCGGGNVCIYRPQQGGRCSCGTAPGPSNTPAPPPPTAIPTIPRPTTRPTFPPPGWYAPNGSRCNRTNYHIFYTGTSCTGEVGYATEGISPQSQCSTDGTSRCFAVGGQPFSKQITSLWRYDSQACTLVTSPYTPPNMYNTLFTCRWGIPPVSSITGYVTISFTSIAQFDKIYVWLNDVNDNYARFIELNRSGIRNNQPYPYTFSYLFPDRKYDVYVKAYGQSAIFLDNVTYEGSCGSPACRVNPSANVNFRLTFPRPIAGSTNQTTNQAFQQAIEQWTKGQIGPREMSLFIQQIARVPGLQKATCDPRVPNGCSL